MSRILTALRETSWILLKVMEVLEKNLSRRSSQKLFIVSCIFAPARVFDSIQLVLDVNHSFIIMKSLSYFSH